MGSVTTSAAVNVTVGGAAIFYIYADQLNTPRAITNAQGSTVWKWDNVDPFGANAPNENPSGQGNFTFNLRFPGQYFDRETNTHYNYFRDYDPSIGMYVESDPIGLAGGINTYAYVNGRPFAEHDRYGLCPGCNVAPSPGGASGASGAGGAGGAGGTIGEVLMVVGSIVAVAGRGGPVSVAGIGLMVAGTGLFLYHAYTDVREAQEVVDKIKAQQRKEAEDIDKLFRPKQPVPACKPQ